MTASPCEVSVLIPVYNGRAFVGQAIESVLRQTRGDFEIIVVDDTSTDGSGEVVAGYADKRIRSFRNEKNLGLVGNWNACLRHAQGAYITMLHQDDLMEPENLDRKVRALQSIGTRWVASDCFQIDGEGKPLHEHWFRHARALRLAGKSREAQFSAMFFGPNYLCFPTILWHREVTDTLGGFEEKGGFCVDIYMWLKILSRYRLTYLDERLVKYRWAQNESLKYKPTDWFYDEFIAKRDAARDLGLPASHLAMLKVIYAQRFVRRYASCRLHGDDGGARTMRRGLSAVWA